MTAAVDLNNEMILMRKEIKRAKLWAISKLVRHIRSMRNKKGNEVQKAKNMRRAGRLVEEIDVIKELKPDAIFKMLLSCNLGCQDLMNGTISLEKRAVIRIGSANFIQTRMWELKNQAEAFQSHHGSKPLSDAFTENLQSAENQRIMSTDIEEKNETVKLLSVEKAKSIAQSIAEDKGKVHEQVPAKRRKKQTNVPQSLNCGGHDVVEPNGLTRKQQDKLSQATLDVSLSEDGGIDLEGKISSCSDSEDRLKMEERVVGKFGDDYQVVIPAMYPPDEPLDVSKKKNFNLLAEAATNDITELLPNVGANFDSDGNSNSDLELDDVGKLSERGRWEKAKDLDKEDLFFVNTSGDPDNQFRRRDQTECENSARLEEESRCQVKSCFLESLASVSHQRTKGKNRMSQRARKKFASKNESNDNVRVKRATDLEKKTALSRNIASRKTSAQQPLHPSWEASRKRKQAQSGINKFLGKLVCFDDSD